MNLSTSSAADSVLISVPFAEKERNSKENDGKIKRDIEKAKKNENK